MSRAAFKAAFLFYLINDRSQFAIEKAGGALQSLLGISCAPRGWTFVSLLISTTNKVMHWIFTSIRQKRF